MAGLPQDDIGTGPVLVSFNGGGLDLPVLRLPGLAQSLSIPGKFQCGRRDRFGRDHIDLCDLLSGFRASARPSLNEMAAHMGVPAKLYGIDGSKVEALAEAGRLDDIANYCLGDVITSFRLLSRFALVRGEIDEGFVAERIFVDEAIERQAKHRLLLSGCMGASQCLRFVPSVGVAVLGVVTVMIVPAAETIDVQRLLGEARTERADDLFQPVVERLGWLVGFLQPLT